MPKFPKFGRLQVMMLKALDKPHLHRPRGIWHHRIGWTLDGVLPTLKVLEGLRRRGIVRWDPYLATEVGSPSNQTYRLTPEGEAEIVRLKDAGWENA